MAIWLFQRLYIHSPYWYNNLRKFSISRTITPVWIHRWPRNDAYSLTGHPFVFQGNPSNCKVTGDNHRFWQIGGFRTVTPVWINQWLWNDAQSLVLYCKVALLLFEVIHDISKSHNTKNWRFKYRAWSTVKQRRAVGAVPFVPTGSNQNSAVNGFE